MNLCAKGDFSRLAAFRAAATVVIWMLSLSPWGCHSDTGMSAFVEDRAGLLTEDQVNRIDRLNRQLLKELDIHIHTVVLADSPANIHAAAVEIFENSRIGQDTKGARGVLFLVDPTGGQVRLEIGYDLEGVFTDAFVGSLERRQMVPFFQTNQVGAGIEAAVELLVSRAFSGNEAEGGLMAPAAPLPEKHFTGGGGARVDVTIGTGTPDKKASPHADLYGPKDTPQMALEAYKSVLRSHIKDPDLGLYTVASRVFFRRWLVTDAQQDNELRSLESMADAGQVYAEDNKAVIRFPLGDRRFSPFFFRRGADGWMIDFAGMHHAIGFNHKNQWFFRSRDHEFMFAFNDLSFDRHGFAHKKP